MSKRMISVFAAILFAFSGLLMRLYRLANGEWKEAASNQAKVTVTLARARGTIYDRNGVPLTNASSRYKASVISTPEALASLAQLLPSEEWQQLRERLQSGKPVVTDLDGAVSMADGVTLALSPVRYQEEQLASHVLGYVSDDGTHGVCGIEKAYDEWLLTCGGEASVTYETDGRGQVLAGGKVEVSNTLAAAKAGLVLTLDASIQRAVECRCAPLLKKGAVVVTDPTNGDVLALASFPSFQPTRLATYLTAEDQPLFNRATAAYNCGSVFKILSTVTALEAGIPATQTFSCSGRLRVGRNVINCHHTLGHGRQTLSAAFINSCNPYYIQLVRQAGSSHLYRMATSLGFGSSLTLCDGYTTAASVFPTAGELLQPTTLANVSFGQGSLTATPLHIAQLTASVVTDGSFYPLRLVKATVDAVGNQTEMPLKAPVRLYSGSNAALLREMMRGVVEEGNGKAARPNYGGAGGKTGTAETGWKTENGSLMIQSWFTGFYPAENPQYVVTVLSEDAETTDCQAAPVFKTVCDELYKLLDKSTNK